MTEMFSEKANEIQIAHYDEMRGIRDPAEKERFKNMTRDDARKALEEWAILPSDAQMDYVNTLLRQLGDTISVAEKDDYRAAAFKNKSNCSNVIDALKDLVKNRRGRFDGRRHVH